MSPGAQALRARYVSDSVTTASPARLLTMLYDRLVLDLRQAEGALREADAERADGLLRHAQDIILELYGSLKPDLWEPAAGLGQLYLYLLSELAMANVRRDAERVATARQLLEPLQDAWHQAAAQLSS